MGRHPKPVATEDDLRAAIYADFERAAATLYYLEARDGSGLQLTTLWPDQLLLTRTLQAQRRQGRPARGLVVKTRRAGTSSASAEWTFHNFYWRPRQKALLVAHHDSTTSVLYDLYRTLYSELPQELQLPLHKLNRKELSTLPPHGSSLVAQTAGYLDIGRGPTIQHAHLSEIDFWPDPEVALDGILNAVHLGVDTSIIIESTANGADGWLHHFWRESQRGKTIFAPIFMPWFRVPEHRVAVPADFEPTAEERAWMAEYALELEQIAWYRVKMNETIAKEPWGGERKMRQEHPFCLVGSTRVSTEAGIVPLAESGAACTTESGPILGLYPQGMQSVVRVTTQRGHQIIGTPDHRIERVDGTFVRLDASRGALVNLRGPMFAEHYHALHWSEIGGIESTMTIDEHWGKFLGYFMGDGSYHMSARSHSGYVSIVCTGKDTDVVDDVHALFLRLFGSAHDRGMSAYHPDGSRGAIEVRVGCNGFLPIMKRLGIWNDDGPHRRVCVPEAIFRSPKTVVAAFLSALFEADGFSGFTHTTAKVQLASKWPEFLRDVQLLLLGFGITSRVDARAAQNRDHPYIARTLTLRTNEALEFHRQIGFVGARKRSTVRPLRAITKHRLPIEMIDSVVSVEAAGRDTVYDLALADRHTFSANGIVSHNTDAEAFQSSGFCIFPDVVLGRLKLGCTPPTIVRRLEHLPTPGEIREVPSDYDPRWPLLTIWKEAEEGRFYALGVDVGDGVNQSESVVQVCAYPGYEQVAEWASATNSVEETIFVARHLAERYGGTNCTIVPEVNRNGKLILMLLYNLPGNYSVFRWRYFDRPGLTANDNPTLGWETNQNTKPVLGQIANLIFLRGQGEVRSDVLHEQMGRCIDLMPSKRWGAVGGRSDRILAWLIAMAGCFLDYEGGSVGHMISDHPRRIETHEVPNWREPGSFDSGVDEVFAGRLPPIGSAFQRGDMEER